jgi:acyl carrier protein
MEHSEDVELARRVIATIVREAGKGDTHAITLETTFEDLGLDSFDAVSITFALEEEFNVDIPGEGLRDFKIVGDIVAQLVKLRNQGNEQQAN